MLQIVTYAHEIKNHFFPTGFTRPFKPLSQLFHPFTLMAGESDILALYRKAQPAIKKQNVAVLVTRKTRDPPEAGKRKSAIRRRGVVALPRLERGTNRL